MPTPHRRRRGALPSLLSHTNRHSFPLSRRPSRPAFFLHIFRTFFACRTYAFSPFSSVLSARHLRRRLVLLLRALPRRKTLIVLPWTLRLASSSAPRLVRHDKTATRVFTLPRSRR